jgi:hypothetical protein
MKDMKDMKKMIEKMDRSSAKKKLDEMMKEILNSDMAKNADSITITIAKPIAKPNKENKKNKEDEGEYDE